MRDYDDELLTVARIKKGADDRIVERIDTGIKTVKLVYGLIAVIVAITIYVVTMRNDLNNEIKEGQRRERLINQLYEKVFGYKVAF